MLVDASTRIAMRRPDTTPPRARSPFADRPAPRQNGYARRNSSSGRCLAIVTGDRRITGSNAGRASCVRPARRRSIESSSTSTATASNTTNTSNAVCAWANRRSSTACGRTRPTRCAIQRADRREEESLLDLSLTDRRVPSSRPSRGPATACRCAAAVPPACCRQRIVQSGRVFGLGASVRGRTQDRERLADRLGRSTPARIGRQAVVQLVRNRQRCRRRGQQDALAPRPSGEHLS